MKKITTLFFVFSLLMPFCAMGQTLSAVASTQGDVNNDSQVNIADVTATFWHRCSSSMKTTTVQW